MMKCPKCGNDDIRYDISKKEHICNKCQLTGNEKEFVVPPTNADYIESLLQQKKYEEVASIMAIKAIRLDLRMPSHKIYENILKWLNSPKKEPDNES